MGVNSKVSVLGRVYQAVITGLLLIGVGGCAGGGSDGTGGIVQRTFVGEAQTQSGQAIVGEVIEFRSAGFSAQTITDAEGGFEVTLEVFENFSGETFLVEVTVGNSAQGTFQAPNDEIIAVAVTVNEAGQVQVDIVDSSDATESSDRVSAEDPAVDSTSSETEQDRGTGKDSKDKSGNGASNPEDEDQPSNKEPPPQGGGSILQEGDQDVTAGDPEVGIHPGGPDGPTTPNLPGGPGPTLGDGGSGSLSDDGGGSAPEGVDASMGQGATEPETDSSEEVPPPVDDDGTPAPPPATTKPGISGPSSPNF